MYYMSFIINSWQLKKSKVTSGQQVFEFIKLFKQNPAPYTRNIVNKINR